MTELNYEFRRRLDYVHKSGRLNPALKAKADEVRISDGFRIVIDANASEMLIGVARDLQDYLFTSMNVSTLLTKNHSSNTSGIIRITTSAESPGKGKDLSVPRSYRIISEQDAITICGFDDRGAAQGCYYLEDMMNLREGPFVPFMDTVRTPLFSPRMIHSGWGCDKFPDQHLNAMAHAGLDAILLFVKSPNMTPSSHVDINDLIDRAARFGMDLYLYSYIRSEKHPEDPDAEAFYEKTYGNLIKAHPRAKGIIFVGESCEFPSKDPNTNGRIWDGSFDPLGSATNGLPCPGWWPCTDYPQWLNLLKKILRKYNPDLDIVFWTYNWGWAPEKHRIALIKSLPKDISMQATFEMFEDVVKDGIVTRCVDYSISFEGPGVYFRSEAQAAHERGLRLYSMSNTGGLTWDIGVIPYQPIPFQWERRFKALLDAKQRWGLVGLMESHHYGWWPSFVSELAKCAYWTPGVSRENMIDRIAIRDFGAEGGPLAVKAWQAWSDAWRDYVPTNEDQYGPFRIGPAYLWFLTGNPPNIPSASYAHFGSCICNTDYRPHEPKDVETEIRILERMATQWKEGNDSMAKAVSLTPESKRPDAERMMALGRFILNCIQTTINTKRWWLLKQSFLQNKDQKSADPVLDALTSLAKAEIANAQDTIPLVESDSRLGWEPSMEYLGDREHLELKISLLRKIIDEEIPGLRKKT